MTDTDSGIKDESHLAAIALRSIVLAAMVGIGVLPGQARADDKPRPPKPRITVSAQTTRILRPLDAEGYPDYLAALNEMASAGVTPENNAAVLFFRAFGPGDVNPALRTRFFELLKIEPMPEQGEYLTGYSQYLDKKYGRSMTTADSQELDKALTEGRPQHEFRLIAEWLASNQKPLALVVAGTERAKCYFPLVAPAQTSLLDVQFPALGGPRNAAFLLAARAMQRIRDGKIADAQQDILACHRLGRLVGRMPCSMNALTGIAIDQVAFKADAALMEYGHLSAAQSLEYQRQLCGLPPFPPLAERIDTTERFTFLDRVVGMAHGWQSVRDILDAARSSTLFSWRQSRDAPLNFDAMLRLGNEHFDKAVAAARKPTVAERRTAFASLDRDQQAMRADVEDRSKPAPPSIQIGKTLLLALMPVPGEAETRARTRELLDQLGFGLVAYRADHGTFPDRLDALVPRYVTQAHLDPFSEQPLHYKQRGNGFLLYSVGENGKDEDGRTFASRPAGDDIVLWIPRQSGSKR